MALVPRPFPAAQPHGALREILPGLYFVTGTVGVGPGVRFSRNMMIVREGERLVIVNSVRLNDAGLAELERLGKVTDVVRVAGFHGMDDPFYRDRYGATVWALAGQRYVAGFDMSAPDVYFEADRYVTPADSLPIAGARLFSFGTATPEGAVLVPYGNGTLLVGDALQNWGTTNPYFSLLGKVMMKAMGFIKPYNIGPGWLKAARPSGAQLRSVLELPFENVLPSHGDPVLGEARSRYRPRIEAIAATLS